MTAVMKSIFAVVLAIISFTCFASGENWSGRLNVVQPVYENITAIEARAIAIEKIKLLAAEKAGEYILNTETIVDGKYTQSVEIIGGALVILEDVNQEFNYQNGQHLLSVSALASVDISSLKERLTYITENEGLRDFIHRQNKELMDILNGSITSSTITELVPAKNNSVERLFTKSEIISLKEKIEIESKRSENHYVKSNFIDVINNTEINASVTKVSTIDNAEFTELPSGEIRVIQFKVTLTTDLEFAKLAAGTAEYDRKIGWIELSVNGVKFRKIFLANSPGNGIYRNNLHVESINGKWHYTTHFDVKITPYILDGPFSKEAAGDINISAKLDYSDPFGVFYYESENVGINGKTLLVGEWDKAGRFYINPLEFNAADFLWVKQWSNSIR